MTIADAPLLKNQLTSTPMNDREALKIEAAPLDPLSAADEFGNHLPTLFVVVAVAILVFGLLAAGSAQPLLLTVIAVLAMLGMFLVFGVLAGHIRLGDRVRHGDVVRAALDFSATPVVVTRSNGAAIYWNKAYDGMFGRSEGGPMVALEQASAANPESARAYFRLMRAADRGEARSEDLTVAVPGDPTATRIVRVSLTAFENNDTRQVAAAAASPSMGKASPLAGRTESADAKAGCVYWQFSDVSEARMRTQAQVRRLESKLALFDSMPAGFMAVAGDGSIAYANTAFELWLGHDAGELKHGGRPLSDVAGVEGEQLLGHLAADPSPEHRVVQLDLKRKDDRILPLTLFVEPAADNGFTITAIHRGVAGEAGLHEGSMVHFFQSAPFGIATLDADGNVASSNTALMRMETNGLPVRDQHIADVLCRNAEANEREAFDEALAKVLAGRTNAAPVEITTGDNKQFSRRIYMAPLAPVSGQDAAALYVVDATEQKSLEARVAQAQKMEAVGNLAGGIAHDFNNVLTAIIGLSDLLLQTHRTSDPAYKDIKSIQSAAHKAAGLVANLLGFSRKQTQQFSVLNLGELATESTPILKTAVGEKIELKIQSERDLWYVRADNNQVFNIILNLARNARDAMPDGGTLSIRTRNVSERETQKMTDVVGFTAGEYVAIEVSDTGTGMSPEVMAKIFEPFFTTKGVGKGTGLGLASVYGIVKQSGGYIFPESKVGEGTTFRVMLPRYMIEDDDLDAAALAAKAILEKAPPATTDLTGTGRVLLVEDEIEVRQFAVRALKRQGYQVLEASDGVEALEIMNGDDVGVDIVVSDVVMPEMDGPTLFKELRKRNPSMKVIFVSGYPNEAFRETLGTDDFAFLPKPFSLPQLAAKVKEELAK